MLAEIITFAGIVCAGVLTQGEAGRELSQWIVGPRFVPGTQEGTVPTKDLDPGPLELGSPISVSLSSWALKAFTCWCSQRQHAVTQEA